MSNFFRISGSQITDEGITSIHFRRPTHMNNKKMLAAPKLQIFTRDNETVLQLEQAIRNHAGTPDIAPGAISRDANSLSVIGSRAQIIALQLLEKNVTNEAIPTLYEGYFAAHPEMRAIAEQGDKVEQATPSRRRTRVLSTGWGDVMSSLPPSGSTRSFDVSRNGVPVIRRSR